MIDIGIFASNNFQQLLDGLNQDQVKNLLEILGLLGMPAAGTSLIWLVKKMNGKPKKN